jgi:hypothetical protein
VKAKRTPSVWKLRGEVAALLPHLLRNMDFRSFAVEVIPAGVGGGPFAYPVYAHAVVRVYVSFRSPEFGAHKLLVVADALRKRFPGLTVEDYSTEMLALYYARGE